MKRIGWLGVWVVVAILRVGVGAVTTQPLERARVVVPVAPAPPVASGAPAGGRAVVAVGKGAATSRPAGAVASTAPAAVQASTQASTQAATQKAQRAFLWKVTSPTTTAYLLGSMHMAPKDLYPLSPDIEGAFAKAEVLVVELDLTTVDPMAMLGMVTDLGMYTDGSTLADHVQPATMDALKAYCAANKVPGALFDTMKPWMVGATLTELAAQQQGFDAASGIDMHFLNAAHHEGDQEGGKAGKQIVELESAEAQLKILAGFNEGLQEKFLASSLKEATQMKEAFWKMLSAWKTGDAKAMNDLVMEDYGKDADAKKMLDALLFDRNVRMAEKIEGLLKEKRPVFVVVGAAHLVGEKGLVALLEKEGLKVEQPVVGR